MEHIKSMPVNWNVSCIADLDVKRQGEILSHYSFSNMGKCK
jgi:hypothetical protein